LSNTLIDALVSTVETMIAGQKW